MEWEILLTEGVEAFLDALYETDRDSHRLVNQAILVLERNGPAEGRPLVDTVTASRLEHEGVAAPVGGPYGDPDLVRLRPVPIGGSARGRRQVRSVEPVVPQGRTGGRTPLRGLSRRTQEGDRT